MTSPEYARDALLGQVARLAESDALEPAALLELAEAYAWLVNPDQSHAGRGERTTERRTEQPAEQGLPTPVEGQRPSPGLNDR